MTNERTRNKRRDSKEAVTKATGICRGTITQIKKRKKFVEVDKKLKAMI